MREAGIQSLIKFGLISYAWYADIANVLLFCDFTRVEV